MSSPHAQRPPRPGISFALRFLLAGVLVLVVVGTAVATTIRREADQIVETFAPATEQTKQTKAALSDVEPGKPQTLLLVGDDARKGEKSGQRSDTMILVRLDPDAKVTSMLSLPRDLIVQGGSSARLNASFANGPAGLIDQLKRILSTPQEKFEIHHYVTIRFTAFQQAVNSLGCFYVDVDRKYFNDNNPPAGGGTEPYAAIDVPAGYQRLCGEQSLSYVRFRHLDNDVVREARQSHYLTEARAQIATSSLITQQDKLTKAIFKYVDTDIRSGKGLLGVVKLGLDVVGKPTGRVTLNTTDTEEGALQTTPADLAEAAKDFLHPRAAPGGSTGGGASSGSGTGGTSGSGSGTKKPKKKVRRAKARTPKTLTAAPAAAKALVQQSGIARNFRDAPIYIPRLLEYEARYRENDSRGYDIQSKGGRAFPWQGYRIVVDLAGGQDGAGQYYGIQGTSWKNPPVLALATDQVRLGGRTFKIEYDGRRIRRLIWQTPNGTYWVNNSLKNSLTNNEMRAIARSLVRYEG
jgi:LCP family protein required for cell wall assembly